MKSENILSRNVEDTWNTAARLAENFPGRLVVALHGDLGAGKTCFVKGLASAIGIKRHVTSPTFTMINEYPGRRPLIHIDLYRIGGAHETAGLGIEEYFDRDCVVAIEWAEKGSALLPAHTVHIRIEQADQPESRKITIEYP